MFSFLNPIFLWAAAAAAVALILHLMQRRRTVRIPFSTIRFLKMAQKRSSSRIRMENFLLWLVRTLLMLLIAFAFAMPMLRTRAFGSFLAKSSRDIAIIIDGSYSMNYSLGREKVWDKAVQTAVSIIEGLDENDKLCIFMATDDVKPVIEQLTQDKEFALATIKALSPALTPSQLAPAVMAGWEALKQEERRREREIHIITDGQALPWHSFSQTETNTPAKTTQTPPPKEKADEKKDKSVPKEKLSDKIDIWKPEKIDEKTAFFVTCLGVPAPENVAPVNIEIQPSLIVANTPAKVQTRVTYCGAVQNTSIKLFINGEEIASRAVSFGTENQDVTFATPPLSGGKHAARIESPPDNLGDDNSFHFTIEVRESLPVLCVGTRDDILFISKALNPGGDNPSGIKAKIISPEDLSTEDLTAFSTIFLCNAIPIGGQEIMRIEQFVQAGGLLVIFPGSRATISDYKPWSCLPGMPSKIAESERAMTKRILRWAKPQHPILRTLKVGPEGAPVITIRRELAWDKIDPKAETIILSGAESPFLIGKPFGKGQVLIFSVSSDRTWAEFPLSPFYLPILHQVVQYGAGLGSSTPFIWAAKSISLSELLPFATESDNIASPDGDNVPIRASNIEGKTLLRAENLTKPGVYTISKKQSTEREAAFAVNIDRTESDLTPVKKEEISSLIARSNVAVANDKDELQRLIKEHRVGRTLGEMLLWVVLILSIVEVFYANSKMKSIPPLSETLGIESSGKIPLKTEMKSEGESSPEI